MKKLMIVAILILAAGCRSQLTSHLNVRNKFPKDQIEPVPGHQYEWIVLSETNIYFVKDDGLVRSKIVPLFGSGGVPVNPIRRDPRLGRIIPWSYRFSVMTGYENGNVESHLDQSAWRAS